MAPMSSIKKILKSLLFSNNLTPTELARRIDLPQQTIQRITQGTITNPRIKTIETIAKHFDISPEQLLGKSPLFIESVGQTILPLTHTIPVFAFEQLYTTKHEQLPNKPINQIQVNNQYSKETFAIIMNDTSMSPYFDKGCLLIIEPKNIFSNADFVLVHNQKNNTIIFRQILQEGQDFYLKALNHDSPGFQAQLFSKEDRLMGVLIETRQIFLRKPKDTDDA